MTETLIVAVDRHSGEAASVIDERIAAVGFGIYVLVDRHTLLKCPLFPHALQVASRAGHFDRGCLLETKKKQRSVEDAMTSRSSGSDPEMGGRVSEEVLAPLSSFGEKVWAQMSGLGVGLYEDCSSASSRERAKSNIDCSWIFRLSKIRCRIEDERSPRINISRMDSSRCKSAETGP